MRNKYHKKLQHRVNKYIKTLNRGLENDSLWMGRFVAHQIASWYSEYEDKSGGELLVKVRFYDKKTRTTGDFYFKSFSSNDFFMNYLWRAMNNFIVEDIAVWHNEKPLEEVKDYRGVKVEWK